MKLEVIQKPTIQPVTLAEAKDFLNWENTDKDTEITALIKAATSLAEEYTNQIFCQRTYAYSIDRFPINWILLPVYPVRSITSITYINRNESPSTITLPTSVYELNGGIVPSFISLQYNQVWPGASAEENAVTITFIAGHESDGGSPEDFRSEIPDPVKLAIRQLVNKMFDGRHDQSELFKANSVEKILLDAFRLEFYV